MSLDPNINRGSNELDWQAFCYIADEMTELQRQEFEDRMGEDQAVRDAVVRVMELGELAYPCFGPALSDSDSRQSRTGRAPVVEHRTAGLSTDRTVAPVTRRRLPAVLFAAAACIALVAAVWAWQLSPTGERDSLAVMTLDVVDAWSNLVDWDDRESFVSQPAVPVFSDDDPWLTLRLAGISGGEPILDPAGSDLENDLDSESGSWMLVALMDLEREEGSESK